MKTYFVDANIFLRFLTEDDKKKARDCEEFFKRAQKGKILLITNLLVVAEIVWVMLSFYKLHKEEIAEKVRVAIEPEWLMIEEKDILLEALIVFEEEKVDFIDAFNFVWARRKGVDRIISYDEDFDKLDKDLRQTP